MRFIRTISNGKKYVLDETNVKLAIENLNKTIADLITDGCNVGVKNQYLHQHEGEINFLE